MFNQDGLLACEMEGCGWCFGVLGTHDEVRAKAAETEGWLYVDGHDYCRFHDHDAKPGAEKATS